MNNRPASVLNLAALLALGTVAATPAAAQTAPPNALNFQGRLARPDATPVADGTYNLRLRVYNAATGGNTLIDQSLVNVPVKNGVFAVTLSGFTADKFNGNTWLGISINGGADLAPRTQIVSVPYALKSDLALTVPNGSITNAKLAGGITADKFASNIFNPIAWLLNGNSGVTSGFLGTIDDPPLEFRVNGRRAMRYQYAEFNNPVVAQFRSINVLGGSEINSISADVVGATIAGGGEDDFGDTDYPNRVAGDFGTVGGGSGNAASDLSTVAGGKDNSAIGLYSTIGGGNHNFTIAYYPTIAGGGDNVAIGDYSTVAGGHMNTAGGDYSFAAGRRAIANHNGAFVWADSANADFTSTGVNQFLIRANGGVGINTVSPGGAILRVVNPSDVVGICAGDLAPIGAASFESHRAINTSSYHFVCTNSGTDVFYVNGSGRPFGTGAYAQISDARFKHKVNTIDNALDGILNLRGVTYEWDTAKWKERGLPSGKQIGFIAQEVEKVLPELVTTDKNGYKSVSYADAVPVLVEAVKTQQKQMDALKKNNDSKDAKIAELEARLERLEAALHSGK